MERIGRKLRLAHMSGPPAPTITWWLRFHIYHENGKICAHRTDHNDPWGMHLVGGSAWPK